MRTISAAWLVIALLVAALAPAGAGAAAADQTPAMVAESLRADLASAQLTFGDDASATLAVVATAEASYTAALGPTLATSAPAFDQRARDSLAALRAAAEQGDGPGFAAARSQLWTAILGGAYGTIALALQNGDAATAQLWLTLREYRQATRFARPSADATVAVDNFAAGQGTAADALAATQADFYDAYQSRLDTALGDTANADSQNFATRRAELAALAEGYFAIVSDQYAAQRGTPALTEAQAAFTALRDTARTGQPVGDQLKAVQGLLQGFRAAPLTPTDQARRASQLVRYLGLIPVEYGRGVKNGVVTRDLEIQEAITFRSGAAAAFADVQAVLAQQDPAATAEAARLFDELGTTLQDSITGAAVASPDAIGAATDHLIELVKGAMPADWQKHDTTGDFDVIATLLDQMETAAAAGEYDLAESARLEAYAVLESGPEAKLVVFAPQLTVPIEDLFWYGQGDHPGLAYLISKHSSVAKLKSTRAALDTKLAEAQSAVGGSSSPVATATNAGIIVFREGLEAVLILASLLGSLKMGTNRQYRSPLWLGAAGAFAFSVATWFVARGLLTALARYGEKLEAIVSLVAIGVLITITNWFFHKVYWTGWMANFHQAKGRILGRGAGQWVGLAILGFTSIYREGLETVIFLQALVLESGVATVLAGIAVGLAATALIGVIVFALQAKLPYKKMLIATGITICLVLMVMVGNTAHVLQIVGWLPTHPVPNLYFPYWSGLWFGVFATWEGLILQVTSGGFVVGSYLLAEHFKDRRAAAPRARTATSTAR
jgi:high-affinity iron transporter